MGHAGTSPFASATTLQLLTLQISELFDPAGPAGHEHRHLAVATTPNGSVALAAPVVEQDVAERIDQMVRTWSPAGDGATPPVGLEACRALMAKSLGASVVLPASGPTFRVTTHAVFSVDTPIVSSEDAGDLDLTPANPGLFDAEEWVDLLNGSSGPWAAALDRGVVVSICHTSLLSEFSAEAGTWTRADLRGRGLAAATVSAWAQCFDRAPLARFPRALFYSTSTTNRSSQRVAERLGLQRLGTIWWLGAP